MRPKSLLVLAGLVLGLLAFIWFFERDLPSSDERTAQAKRLVVLEAADVDRVEILRDGRSLVLERDRPDSGSDPAESEILEGQSEWRLTAPIEASADRLEVESLVDRLVGLEKGRVLEQVTRDDVGLTNPRAVVTLEIDGAETRLEIGAEVPASNNMTVAVGGRDEFYVVSNAIWNDLERPVNEWREKKLVSASQADIDRLVLEREGTPVVLSRREGGFWLEAPVVDRASESDVNALLTEISGLRAERFVEAEEGAAATEPPTGVLTVSVSGRDTPIRIELGKAESDAEDSPLFARVDDQWVTLEPGIAGHLERSVDAWRSRKWATSQLFAVERAVVEDAAGEIELRRDGAEWLRDGERLVYGPTTDLLYELTGAEIERFDAPDAEGLGEPQVSITLEGAEGAAEILRLFSTRGEFAPVTTSARDAVLLLPAATAEEIVEKIAALRAADLAPPEQTDAGDVEDDGG